MVETDDRRAAAEDLIQRLRAGMTVEEALETPFLLIGTAEEMAGQLVDSRARYGFSHVTERQPYMEAFAPVIERLAAGQGRHGAATIPNRPASAGEPLGAERRARG